MLTPQEVEERVFPKAKKAGYDMQDVDNFLDQLTADYTELYKENAVLKRKMKVLADKITEYQETEGAMRATLLAAQKMADQMVDEAKAKREKMLSDAETIVKGQLGKLSRACRRGGGQAAQGAGFCRRHDRQHPRPADPRAGVPGRCPCRTPLPPRNRPSRLTMWLPRSAAPSAR